MKSKVTLAAFALWAGAAHGQGWGLTAPTVECAALESLVVFGLIDGGEGGDTSALSDVVFSGDAATCAAWLGDYGYPGLANPDCVDAFSVLSTNGLPEWLQGEEQGFITDILAPSTPESCADMLFDLTAGQ